ncbi:FLYWCH zinc finger domain-containing protein [Ditylenchus destructor]|nr:FLYWCH zinc finger domain-containing protein [Ditylenchus destructor]
MQHESASDISTGDRTNAFSETEIISVSYETFGEISSAGRKRQSPKLSRNEMDQSLGSEHRSRLPKHGYPEGQRYFYKGFTYVHPRRVPNKTNIFWMCINYRSTKKCNANLLTNLANVPIDYHVTHNHEPTAPGQPNGLESEDSIRKRYEQVRDKSVE